MRLLSKLSLFFLFMPTVLVFGDSLPEKLLAQKIVGKVLIHSADKSPYSLQEGEYQIKDVNGIFALNDGQGIFKLGDDFRFRLKEDSTIQISNLGKVEISRGVGGFSIGETPKIIRTPHFEVSGSNCIIVIKANPILTRICVIKGEVEISKATEKIRLKSGEEIAASDNKFSKIYTKTAELRFAWYWVEPDKEPSFQ